MTRSKPDVFLKQPEFKFQPRSVVIFIAAALAGWAVHFLAQVTFPGGNLVPYLVRTTVTLAIVLGLGKLTFYLLKQNGLSGDVLGLQANGKALKNLLTGVGIGAITIVLLMAGLSLVVPFSFVSGPLHGIGLLKESLSYLLGNTLEELMFRGFLLIILTQLTDWRKAVWILALPFGLFHLPGLGLSIPGLKMVLTTATLSFVFCYAFILTGSLLTAIATHITMNILLHAFLGLDGAGNASYIPVFNGRWPAGYDAALVVTVGAGMIVATGLYLLILYRNRQLLQRS